MVAFESMEVIFVSFDEPVNAVVVKWLLVFKSFEEFMTG